MRQINRPSPIFGIALERIGIFSFLTLRNEMSTKERCRKGGGLKEKEKVWGSDELTKLRLGQWGCFNIWSDL